MECFVRVWWWLLLDPLTCAIISISSETLSCPNTILHAVSWKWSLSIEYGLGMSKVRHYSMSEILEYPLTVNSLYIVSFAQIWLLEMSFRGTRFTSILWVHFRNCTLLLLLKFRSWISTSVFTTVFFLSVLLLRQRMCVYFCHLWLLVNLLFWPLSELETCQLIKTFCTIPASDSLFTDTHKQ